MRLFFCVILHILLACRASPARFGEFSQELRQQTPRVQVSFFRVDAAVAADVFHALDAALSRVHAWGELQGAVDVQIYPSHAALEDAAQQPGIPWLRAWATASTIYLQSPRTWGGGSLEERLEELLTHELTHVLTYQYAKKTVLPLWFVEGMASVVAEQGYRRLSPSALGMWLAERPQQLLSPSRETYRDEREWVYSASHRAFEAFLGAYGKKGVRCLLSLLQDGKTFSAAFFDCTDMQVSLFEASVQRSWREAAAQSPIEGSSP